MNIATKQPNWINLERKTGSSTNNTGAPRTGKKEDVHINRAHQMRIPIYINRNSRIRRSIKKNNIKLDKQAVGLIPVQAKYINKFIRTKIKLRLKSPSRNRRVCNQILTQNRDTTPERQNNRTYQHVFKTRETVKLTLVDTGDMHQSIRDALKRFLKALTKSDSSATLMPWVTKSHLKELH